MPEAQKRDTLAVAPMSPLFVVLTGVLLAIPTIWAILGVIHEPLRRTALVLVPAALALIATVWLVFRPQRFERTADGVELVFPLRRLHIMRAEVTRATRLDRPALHRQTGITVRVGFAGLFGNFGLLWTTKLGWVSVYSTSLDEWVLVERKAARPILLSPADPDALVRALR